jgi:hypothetical protein
MSLYANLIDNIKVAEDEQMYKGIKGWLLLPAVSIFTTTMMLAGLLLTNYKLINNPFINSFIVEYPGFRETMIAQTLIVAMQLLLLVYVAFLFFQRKRALPSMIIAFLTIHLLIIIANLYWTFTLFKEINYQEYAGVIAAVLMVGCGIPYFVKSKRVRFTFVNP